MSFVDDDSRGNKTSDAITSGAIPSGNDQNRSIGSIIGGMRTLSADQVEQVLRYQRERNVRFGEAAVALKLVTPDDVLEALSQQFDYPYAPSEQQTRSSELVALTQPFSAQAEAFRLIRSQLMMRLYGSDTPRRALAIISADSKDGRTFFSANLAITLAQLGGRTLLVDADMRVPRQHEVFALPNEVGLSSLLSGRAERSAIRQISGVPSLFVLPVGATPPNPLELVERSTFGVLMHELTNQFDHVIVDTPAAVYGADCGVIASRCGAALVVARKDESKIAALEELVQMLNGSVANMVGVVVNNF